MDLKTNVLYFGDNLDILRHHIPDESVDLRHPRLEIRTIDYAIAGKCPDLPFRTRACAEALVEREA